MGAAIGNIAFLGYLFKYINNEKVMNVCKVLFCFFLAMGFAIAGIITGWTESIFVASQYFGFVVATIWKKDTPNEALDKLWTYLNPPMFVTAGALILINKISSRLVGQAICIIIISLFLKMVACMLTSSCMNKWTLREKLFISICQVPKAAVQASLSGMFLSDAKKYGIPEFL